MRSIVIFGEDSFHQDYLTALMRRFAEDQQIPVEIHVYSARGGITRLHHELKQFLRDLHNDRTPLPDAVLVACDANCQGYVKRRGILEKVVKKYDQIQRLVVYAIPDPHVERWMLVDPTAFQRVFGRGCNLPRYKCDRGRYKKILTQEIVEAGIQPALGGREYSADIIREMDIAFAEQNEDSLGRLLHDLKGLFNRWSQP